MSETKFEEAEREFDKEIGAVATNNLAGRAGPPTPRVGAPTPAPRLHAIPDRRPAAGPNATFSVAEYIRLLEEQIKRADAVCATLRAANVTLLGVDPAPEPDRGKNSLSPPTDDSLIAQLSDRLVTLESVLNEMVHYSARIEQGLGSR